MLSRSDISIANVLQQFSEKHLDIGFLVPTETALVKSIIDAHGPFRDYLERNRIHDYSQQHQGEKILIEGTLISPSGNTPTKVSLYRPQTKDGDPRVWIYGLKDYSQPFNLIGVIFKFGHFYIINCSQPSILEYAFSRSSPLAHLFKTESFIDNQNAKDLLSKLKAISAQGFIPTIKDGDTGIGMTLESLLGVAPNSSTEPDYNGIELKSSRATLKKQKNRVTLFSKVPDWPNSPIKDAISLLKRRGYMDKDNRLSLYHTINGKSPNSLGLMLEIDYERELLKQTCLEDTKSFHDTSWKLSELKASLKKKHPETFWVKADTKIINGKEHFHFTEAVYTSGPYIHNFEALVEDGVITLDYTMHLKDNGDGVRDHGYLFKILPNNFNALFPPPQKFTL